MEQEQKRGSWKGGKGREDLGEDRRKKGATREKEEGKGRMEEIFHFCVHVNGFTGCDSMSLLLTDY